MHSQTDNDRVTDGCCSFPYRISQIMLFSPDEANNSSSLILNLSLVADAYCLLDVYSVLSSNPAYFGLPADLRSISSSQSEKSADKKQKEKQAEQMKQVVGESRSQVTSQYS